MSGCYHVCPNHDNFQVQQRRVARMVFFSTLMRFWFGFGFLVILFNKFGFFGLCLLKYGVFWLFLCQKMENSSKMQN